MMSFSRGLARAAWASTLLMVSTYCANVSAQDEDSENYRDCSDEALAEMAQDDLSAAPATSAVLDSGLTREEAEEVRQQIYSVRQRQIDQFHDMLADMPAGYERRGDVLFRLAEAYWAVGEADNLAARADYNACIDDWMHCLRDEPCQEPLPDYSMALDQYRQILRDHPDYPRIDEVIFRLGDGLIQADEAADGIQFLQRLINNYAQSQYIPDAYFLRGDYFFDNGLMMPARESYTGVLDYPQNDYYNFSLYKLGWVDMNEVEWRSAVERFQLVISNIDREEAGGSVIRFDLRAQSLNDMLVAWTEIDQGWVEARLYLTQNYDEDTMRRKLLAMGDMFDEKGFDESRVDLLEWFVENYPNDSSMPTWAEQLRDSLTKIGQWDRFEERMRTMVQLMDPNGTWAIVNEGDERAVSMARMFSEETFLGIILRNYQECIRLSRMELCDETATDYDEFFRRWADSDVAYEQRFNYAEMLYYNLERYPEAGEQYLEVVRTNPEGEHAHDSAVGALQAFDDLMKSEVPDIDDEHEIVSEATLQCDAEPGQLGPWSEKYVEVVGYFADWFPDDERVPVASWRAAELYRRVNRIGDAAARFETIIAHHPTHRFAEEAAISAFLCYRCVEDWVKIESIARRLLELNLDNPDLNAERLQQAIAFAISEQAADFMEVGEELSAAELYMSLFTEFPESEFAAPALYSAAAVFERARRIDTAVSTYNTFLESYPDDPNAADARFTLGLIHDSQAEFATAADWFESLSAYPDFPEYSNAVFNAGRLREALSEFDTAIAHYENFMAMEPGDERNAGLYFIIAKIEEGRGNIDIAYDRYQSFRTEFPSESVRQIAARAFQARIRVDQANDRAATNLYEEILDGFGAGVMTFDEGGLPVAWEVSPGSRFEDPAERTAALPFAAEARFYLADKDFEACQIVSLDYPEGRVRVLSENLQSRGRALDTAQRGMFEVIEMGDAAWSVAATTRIGELYAKFYNDMYELPQFDLDECLDSGYSYDACDEADVMFSDMMYNMMLPIETKALESFGRAVRIAHENNVYTEWSARAVEMLQGVDRSIRVTGEQGVVATNAGQLYTGATYVTDISDRLVQLEQEYEERQRLIRELERQRQQGGPVDGADAPSIEVPDDTAPPVDEEAPPADEAPEGDDEDNVSQN